MSKSPLPILPETAKLYRLHEQVARHFDRALFASNRRARRARDYLHDRGYDPEELAERFGIGFGAYDDVIEEIHPRLYKLLRRRLIFFIRDPIGRVIAFAGRRLDDEEDTPKYKNSPASPIFAKGLRLYGLHQARYEIRRLGWALVVEGQTDVQRCHLAGVTNAVASMGVAVTEAHAHILKRYADRVVAVFDGDEAGREASQRTCKVCEKVGLEIEVATLPRDQDPDSFLRDRSRGAFLDLVEPKSR